VKYGERFFYRLLSLITNEILVQCSAQLIGEVVIEGSLGWGTKMNHSELYILLVYFLPNSCNYIFI
jgi:dethiobiotin synthetase